MIVCDNIFGKKDFDAVFRRGAAFLLQNIDVLGQNALFNLVYFLYYIVNRYHLCYNQL